jgi:hypothetical protein
VILQYGDVNEQVRYLSTVELSEIISRCEHAIAEGSAEIDDYELARRTWSNVK